MNGSNGSLVSSFSRRIRKPMSWYCEHLHQRTQVVCRHLKLKASTTLPITAASSLCIHFDNSALFLSLSSLPIAEPIKGLNPSAPILIGWPTWTWSQQTNQPVDKGSERNVRLDRRTDCNGLDLSAWWSGECVMYVFTYWLTKPNLLTFFKGLSGNSNKKKCTKGSARRSLTY